MNESNNRDQFGVVQRNCEPYEPKWVVYQGQAGANAIAHFFDLTQANDYAEMRNKIERNKPKVSHQAKERPTT